MRDLRIIAAVARNNVIGKEGKLPWCLPEDLKRFRDLTWGHTLIMGRKTFESILRRIGKPLEGRRTLVLTRDPAWSYPEVEHASSVDSSLLKIDPEERVFVCGGEEVYVSFMRRAHTINMTYIDKDFSGDALFPNINPREWFLVKEIEGKEDVGFPYFYRTYGKIGGTP